MELTGSMKHICITGYIQYISVSSHPFISRYITGWELPGRNPINRLINCKNTLSFTVHKKQELCTLIAEFYSLVHSECL